MTVSVQHCEPLSLGQFVSRPSRPNRHATVLYHRRAPRSYSRGGSTSVPQPRSSLPLTGQYEDSQRGGAVWPGDPGDERLRRAIIAYYASDSARPAAHPVRRSLGHPIRRFLRPAMNPSRRRVLSEPAKTPPLDCAAWHSDRFSLAAFHLHYSDISPDHQRAPL